MSTGRNEVMTALISENSRLKSNMEYLNRDLGYKLLENRNQMEQIRKLGILIKNLETKIFDLEQEVEKGHPHNAMLEALLREREKEKEELADKERNLMRLSKLRKYFFSFFVFRVITESKRREEKLKSEIERLKSDIRFLSSARVVICDKGDIGGLDMKKIRENGVLEAIRRGTNLAQSLHRQLQEFPSCYPSQSVSPSDLAFLARH